MDWKRKAGRTAAVLLLCVLMGQMTQVLIRPIRKLLENPAAASLLIYLETGRAVKPTYLELLPPATEETQPPETIPLSTQPMEAPGIMFSQQDAQLIQVSNFCAYRVDIPALLLTELTWDLTQPQPQVLILHSHATESYTQTEQAAYEPSAAYRTLDNRYNMIRVGQELKEALEAKGIQVIHDQTLHDHPNYSDAYIHSRETVRQWQALYPSIALVIDLHRDAAGDTANHQLQTAATVDGEPSAQLMMVVGSNAGGRTHPDWKQNMALAAKLHAQLEKRFPGICRPISFRTERFNQDLSPGALLIEVGAAGDTLEEALVAVSALAEGIGDLAYGTITADSTS